MDDSVPSEAPQTMTVTSLEPTLNKGGTKEDSDIFLCTREIAVESTPCPVTLFVFGWHNVEPGPLSWPFPSLKAAHEAVKTMKNAAQWCIVSGNDWPSMDAARSSGAVLIEELG